MNMKLLFLFFVNINDMRIPVNTQRKIVVLHGGDERLQAYALVLRGPSHLVMVDESAKDFLKHRLRTFPDLVIFNPFTANGEGEAGLGFIPAVKRVSPRTKVLVISDRCDETAIKSAFTEGASGFVLFSMHLHDFLRSVNDLFEGGAPMSREVAACLVSSYQVTAENPLTRREQDVLRELGTGKTYPYIANDLHLSVHTVRSHIQNIFDKLNVRNKSEALVLARIQRLI